jgi:hypothetical protein
MSLSEAHISTNGKAAKTPVFAAFLVIMLELLTILLHFFIIKATFVWAFGPHVNTSLLAEKFSLIK